jgi:pimeloyl-ACP methyl ester carboxylesterase
MRSLAVLRAVTTGLALAGLAGVSPRAQESAARAPGEAPQESPANLRLGRLDFFACDIGSPRVTGVATQSAFCASLDVPEDWDHPQGRHIALRLAVVRSLAAQADPDPLVFLDGGPGGAATEDYPAIAPALTPLRKHRHIILLDQRGTGGSNALDCGGAARAQETRLAAKVFSAAEREKAARDRTRLCLEAIQGRADPRLYATTDAVRDLEALRLALGSPRFNLLGVSYGTRLAQQYAMRHPDGVRSIVLDSPVPNTLVLLSEHARNLEDAARRRLQVCREDSACAQRFGDPYARLRAVHARLLHTPLPVDYRDPYTNELRHGYFSADDLAGLVRFYLYSATTSPMLPLVIEEAQAGRVAPLVGQERLVVGEASELASSGLASSVLCTEDADLLHEQPADADTLLGVELVRIALQTCAQWPHRGRPADFHDALHGEVPVLVIGGEFDPVTPPRYGEQIVGGLSHARLLVAKGQGHAVMTAGCMPRLIGDFVREPVPAKLDPACLDRLGSAPAVLDMYGPAP